MTDLIWDMAHPVGSVMQVANGFDPNTVRGTWERIEGRFLLASSGSYPRGSEGGEAAHTLTVSEMPRHRHNAYMGYGTTDSGNDCLEYGRFSKNRNWGAWLMGEDGGDQPHNNMPPYIAVDTWRRVA